MSKNTLSHWHSLLSIYYQIILANHTKTHNVFLCTYRCEYGIFVIVEPWKKEELNNLPERRRAESSLNCIFQSNTR